MNTYYLYKKCAYVYTRHYNIFEPCHIENISLILSPWFVTGFTDAEGCFMCIISRNTKVRLGWTIALRYNITLGPRDLPLLKEIQAFFGIIGRVGVSEKKVYFDVNSMKELSIIISHFLSYPLQSQKRFQFNIFMCLYNLFSAKTHLTVPGFLQCISLINVLNNPVNPHALAEIIGRYGTLPALILPPVPIIVYQLTPQWILGFIAGEGCFSFFRSTLKSQIQVFAMVIEISQLPIDNQLLLEIGKSIGPCALYTRTNYVSRLRFSTLPYLQHYVLPFFFNNPLPVNSYKRIQYDIWLSAVEIALKGQINYNSEMVNAIKNLSDVNLLLALHSEH